MKNITQAASRIFLKSSLAFFAAAQFSDQVAPLISYSAHEQGWFSGIAFAMAIYPPGRYAALSPLPESRLQRLALAGSFAAAVVAGNIGSNLVTDITRSDIYKHWLKEQTTISVPQPASTALSAPLVKFGTAMLDHH